MQLSAIVLAAGALAATANAFDVELIAENFDARGVFNYDNGISFIDREFNDGCLQRNIPGIDTLCMDWINRRGHVIQTGTAYCFQITYQSWTRGNGPDMSLGAQ